jgi:hypothetical protein
LNDDLAPGQEELNCMQKQKEQGRQEPGQEWT